MEEIDNSYKKILVKREEIIIMSIIESVRIKQCEKYVDSYLEQTENE